MNQYIITEEQIANIEEHGWIDAFHTLDQVRSHPYQSERDKVLDEMLAALQNEGMAAWEERGYRRFIQSFRQVGE